MPVYEQIVFIRYLKPPHERRRQTIRVPALSTGTRATRDILSARDFHFGVAASGFLQSAILDLLPAD
jgi:hypothetical protein